MAIKTLILWVVFVIVACTSALPAISKNGDLNSLGDNYLTGFTVRNLTNPLYYGPIAGGGFLILLTLVSSIAGVCYCYNKKKCCWRQKYELERRPLLPDARYSNGNPARVEVGSRHAKRRQERTVAEELRRQKEQQEHNDRVNANKIVRFFLRSEKVYEFVEELPDMGSRMLKFWHKIRDTQAGKDLLLTIAPVSQKCPLVLEDRIVGTMNLLFRQLRHPNLHPAHRVHFINKDHMVIIIQPFRAAGSLKDKIYKSAPTSEWTVKYSRRCKGLSTKLVALYGRQILEGLRYLYEQGFPPLGHVQTGNVFMEERNVCKLGGFENTLLGYKTRAYKLCKEHLEHIDLILFGHVIFEIACGYELTEIAPGEMQYRDVKDERVREILRFIFQTDGDGAFTSTIEKVHQHVFFQQLEIPLPEQQGARTDTTPLTKEMKDMLAKVAKNKPRVQKPPKKDKKKKKQSSSSGAQGNNGRGSLLPPS